MTDVYRLLNNFLINSGYNNCNNTQKLKLINQGLRIYLTEKIKEKNPEDTFVNGYANLSVETLLTVLDDRKISEDIIHFLINCMSNIQGYEIIWYIAEDDDEKKLPLIDIKNNKVNSLTSRMNGDVVETYKFVDDTAKLLYSAEESFSLTNK